MEIFKMRSIDLNDEGVIRLGIKCIEAMTEEYLDKHNKATLDSYRNFLKYQLTYCSWLRSAVDPDEILDCMERVRQEKLRNDASYKAQWYENETRY